MKTGDFGFHDESFLKFEQVLAGQRPAADDLWKHRVGLFCHLVDSAYAPRGKRFKFGLLSYSIWLLMRILPAKRFRVIAPPPADFLVHIVGNVSKEVDTLSPVVAALREAGHSVLVLWGSEEPVPEEVLGQLKGATVWTIPGLAKLAVFRPFLVNEAFSTLRMLWSGFRFLRPMKGARRALWRCSAWWFHDLLQFKCWERLLATTLANHHFKGVAVVSETAASAEALCRVALRNGWPIHHFWHGLAGFTYSTRCIANHLHLFSQADRDYFARHGWPSDRAHATGHPRQIRLASEIHRLRVKPVTEGGLRVLFASQPEFADDFSIQQYRDTMAAVLQAAKTLNLTADELRVRLHPAESTAVYLEMVEKYLPELRNSLLSKCSVAEDLAWANVLVTTFSTMSIEACYAECFLIWLVVGDGFTEVCEDLFRHGYGHKATSTKQLIEELKLCRDPAKRSDLILNLVKTGRTLGIINENAASAAATIMISGVAPDEERIPQAQK